MKAQRDWCGLIPWLLAASLLALQAQLAGAADTPAGPSITINRGESYVIKGASPDGAPVVTPIDNPGSLIVNKQPDGSILVLGADAGVETVKVTTADGKAETYTITVRSNSDPKNPLAPGSASAAAPLDEGSGPADSAASKNGAPRESSPSGSTATAAAEPKDTGATPVSAPAASEPSSSSSAPKAADASASPDSSAPAAAASDSGIAPDTGKIVTLPEPSASASKPADSGSSADAAKPAPASIEAAAAPTTPPKADAGTASAEATGGSAAPLGLSTAGGATPSQAASAAAEKPEKYAADPRVVEEEKVTPAAGRHYLPEDGITLMFGTSRIFDFPSRIKRVSIADSEVADLQVVNPHQLMLIGHKPGFTTLAVWDDQGRYEERQVRIEQTGHQQVLLNCTVAEVNRSKVENQGVNLSAALSRAGVTVVGLPGSVATPYNGQTSLKLSGKQGSTDGALMPFGGELLPLLLSSGMTYGVATDNGQLLTNSFFQFLEDHQLGRILAEPHILANSGQEAKFLSGGEIPIVIAQALNTSVVFKQFGTSVVFIPTVIGKRDIELVVKPEVSKPDFSQGIQLLGFTVPAFVTRRAETVVRMKENQTLIIAGLILRDRRAQIDKVPYLGDLPFAGALFRNTQYQDVKTELVMSVTPQIVGAVPSGAQVAYPEKEQLTAQEIRTQRLSEPDVTRPRF